MISFIKTYGTHYAKSTIMGIGVDFETRYTEKETLNNNKQTRDECSTRSGKVIIHKSRGEQFLWRRN